MKKTYFIITIFVNMTYWNFGLLQGLESFDPMILDFTMVLKVKIIRKLSKREKNMKHI